MTKAATTPRTVFPYFVDQRSDERELYGVTRADLRDLSLKPSGFGAFIYRDAHKRISYLFDRNNADNDVCFLYNDRRGGAGTFFTAYKHKYGHVPDVVRMNDLFGVRLLLTTSGPPRPERSKLAMALSFIERRVTGLIWLIRHRRAGGT